MWQTSLHLLVVASLTSASAHLLWAQIRNTGVCRMLLKRTWAKYLNISSARHLDANLLCGSSKGSEFPVGMAATCGLYAWNNFLLSYQVLLICTSFHRNPQSMHLTKPAAAADSGKLALHVSSKTLTPWTTVEQHHCKTIYSKQAHWQHLVGMAALHGQCAQITFCSFNRLVDTCVLRETITSW